MTRSWHIARFVLPVWHSELAQAVDRLSIESQQITALQLMNNAAQAVTDSILAIPNVRGKTIVILAGKGNNGGDGLAVARQLHALHISTTTFIISDELSSMSDGCGAQLQLAIKAGAPIRLWEDGAISKLIGKSDAVIVDALLGLGFKGTVRPGLIYSMLTDASEVPNKIVVAVDLPSGMNPDDGENGGGTSSSGKSIDLTNPLRPLLPADLTITFGCLKPALAMAPSRDFCGTIKVVDIGFPKTAVDAAIKLHPVQFSVADDKLLLEFNPWNDLPLSANKYDRGHIVVLGGSAGKSGAPYLAGLAALRSGAGWVTLSLPGCDAASAPDFSPPPEITYENLWATDFNELDSGASSHSVCDAGLVAAFITSRKVRAIVIGPGTVTQPITEEFAEVLAQFTVAGGGVVIDAGALHNIVPLIQKHQWNADRLVCTPHPGEWLKLSKAFAAGNLKPFSPAGLVRIRDSLRDSSAVLGNFTLVFKGATPTIIDSSQTTEPATICTGGSKVLARAGTGDVIAGVVAAHLAMGMPAVTSFARAYALVCHASSIAKIKFGENSVLATDIIEAIGLADAPKSDQL